MRPPEIAIEAGAWISSSPRFRPRSGPLPFGETVASRSWMRSEISAIVPNVDAAPGDPRRRDDPAPGPEDQGGWEVVLLHVRESWMLAVYLHEVRRVSGLQYFALPSGPQEPGGRRVLPRRDEDVPPAREPAGARRHLPELLERVEPHVRVGADGETYIQLQYPLRREESIAQVPLRGGADADRGAMLRQQLELPLVGVRGVDYGGPGAEETRLGQELYGPHPVVLPALFYLPRLLVGVDVEVQVVAVGVLPDLLQPSRRHGPDAVRGNPDLGERALLQPSPEGVHPLQKLFHLRIPEAGDTAAGVGDGEEQGPDPRLLGGLRDGYSKSVRVVVWLSVRAVVHVVELGDARVTG